MSTIIMAARGTNAVWQTSTVALRTLRQQSRFNAKMRSPAALTFFGMFFLGKGWHYISYSVFVLFKARSSSLLHRGSAVELLHWQLVSTRLVPHVKQIPGQSSVHIGFIDIEITAYCWVASVKSSR